MQGSSFRLERDGFSEKENTKQRKNLFSLDPLIIGNGNITKLITLLKFNFSLLKLPHILFYYFYE